MIAGIWLRYPVVWSAIQVMLSWEVLVAAAHMMLDGAVVGAGMLLLSATGIWIMFQGSVQERFGIVR